MTPRGAVFSLLLLEASALPLAAAVLRAFDPPDEAASWRACARRAAPPAPVLAAALVALAAGALLAAIAPAGERGLFFASALASAWTILASAWAASAARVFRALRAPPALASLLAALLIAASQLGAFVAAPFLRPGANAAAMAWLLALSPVAVMGGSLLGIDVLRAAPLYGSMGLVGEAPFAYPSVARALALQAAAALLSALAASLARPRP